MIGSGNWNIQMLQHRAQKGRAVELRVGFNFEQLEFPQTYRNLANTGLSQFAVRKLDDSKRDRFRDFGKRTAAYHFYVHNTLNSETLNPSTEVKDQTTQTVVFDVLSFKQEVGTDAPGLARRGAPRCDTSTLLRDWFRQRRVLSCERTERLTPGCEPQPRCPLLISQCERLWFCGRMEYES